MSAIIPPPGSDSFHGGSATSIPGPNTGPGGFSDFGVSTVTGEQAVDPPADPKPDISINPSGREGQTPDGGGGGSNTISQGGRQWIRNWKITMGSSSGENLDLSALRMRFKVAYETMQHPTYAEISITNISEQSANKIDKEGVPVSLECGYEDRLKVIFKGTAVYKRYGRENPTDTILQIVARSGDKAYNYAHVSKTLAAGHTFKDQVKVATDAMKEQGVEIGHMADLDPRKFPRAITLHGMAREVLRRVALANDASWTIHNDKIQMIKNREGLPGGAIVISSDTGMIGRPVQTFKGIEGRCLLNPDIVPGCTIKIDAKSIDRVAFGGFTNANFALAGEGNKGGDLSNPPLGSAQPLSVNGEYKVSSVEHSGDTRGQEWYTDFVCYDPKSPPTGGTINSETNLAAVPYSGMPVTDEDKNQQGRDQSAGGT